jgi:hypothetical protein
MADHAMAKRKKKKKGEQLSTKCTQRKQRRSSDMEIVLDTSICKYQILLIKYVPPTEQIGVGTNCKIFNSKRK